ncbi:DUF4200 domain-containing protein [Okeania sp. KiyG1]|uniref:DUF4200 domain-containing protein n=1 Tax=Okeania sp. KiyG1 TaxID=2720165 RepID=UPI0019218331|nr:DUF4200 domain-containing protein [Okeania sp. KiyG1]GGA20703.1 hypothetical protein CYANOKiyG1_35680 [Okeania sp. KiyG1]
MVFLDCCHAGGLPQLKDIEKSFVKSPVPPDLMNILKSGSGRVVVASSREDELSYTGNPYSIFTACLLEGMQGKASVNQDGYARILDTLIYLFDQVPKRTNNSQHPFVNKVLELGDNFPICYYAGGSKFTTGELPFIESIGTTTNLTSGKRRRMEQKRDSLESDYNLRSEKAKRMRADLAIESATAVKFQLEKQLLEEEAKIAELEDEISAIEQFILE